MKAIDRVRNAYAAKRRKLTVPEWGLDMYFGPLTVEDMESVDARMNGADNKYERNVLMLIHKAQDKEGRRLFNFGDKAVLIKEADLVVMNRVVSFMWKGTPEIAEAMKEVEENPTSDSG